MQLPYLNAINILISAEIGVLHKIAAEFEGNFERAWNSPALKKFLPKDGSVQAKINPQKEYARVLDTGLQIITLNDPAYPPSLKNVADRPFLLYIKGNADILNNLCFGIVGTRNPTDYGRRATPVIAEGIAKAGFTIVSGLAMGIDGMAHQTAVKNKLPTIAVLGGGINDNSIVQQNQALSKDIIKTGGAIISEYSLNVHGHKQSFPQRNRIISGLSKGILVVEADEKSGSLITARCALDQNRDVFAVPGSIFSPRSQGPNNLIRAGAKLVASASDILTDYNIQYNLFKPVVAPANELEKKILKSIGHETVTLDQIIRQTERPTREVVSCLMDMELESKVKNLGNNKFCLYT
ncbi:MAG: DNA-processing protein DprA [bacterium]|nr:DNA-processing protein DprA [bacterium]